MSKLRPECRSGTGISIPDDTALFLIRDAVERRRELIFGRLKDDRGGFCALGAFWQDNPGMSLHTSLVDEVAAVNDSISQRGGTPKQRWAKVRSWLRWKVRIMALKASP